MNHEPLPSEGSMPRTTGRPRHIPDIKARFYRDGQAIDQLNYLQVKLILRGDRFRSSRDLRELGKFVGRAARDVNVQFDSDGYEAAAPRIREVLFLDTSDFLLYRSGFILRRRLLYEDGFLVGDPEVVFKYRSTSLQKAAEMDVRPRIAGDYRVKFKADALPLKHRLGGFRLLFSHNVQFALSTVRQVDRRSMTTILEVLPALQALQRAGHERIELVNNVAVDEILVDLGHVDFGKGVRPRASVSLWRTRGDLQQLIGEFGFQIRFARRDDVPEKALRRCEKFFLRLQEVASDWITLGTTKTGAVYALNGGARRAHE